MAQVDFYQLGGTPIERVLPRLAERVVAEGDRLLIVAGDEGLLDRLDNVLWTYERASFLPHGRTGADQPVLLATAVAPVNGASRLLIADGVWRDAALDFVRSFYLFDAETIAGARTAWRALAARQDVDNRFWRQDEQGKWRPGP